MNSSAPPFGDRASIADVVYDELYRRVRSLELPPGTKMSEAEIARQFGVSRQPVRDAFYRLSKLGFLMVRPQRATVVTHISTRDILAARFIRTAIEVAMVERACDRLTSDNIAELRHLLVQQEDVASRQDRVAFYRLDDAFHRRICEMCDVGQAWEAIQENKAHTDRVRFLSLATGSRVALEEHITILDAIEAGNSTAAMAALRHHMSKIETITAQLKIEHGDWFADEG